MKICTYCKIQKDESEFYTLRASSFTAKCKECIKFKRKEYVKTNLEQTRKASTEYYYRVVKTKDSSKIYREKCFKDGRKGFLQTICKAGIKRKGGNITWQFLDKLWENQNGKCAITGYDMTYQSGNGKVVTNVSIDRIDGKGIYTEDNVRLTCVSANIARGILGEKEFIKMCKDIVNYAAKK